MVPERATVYSTGCRAGRRFSVPPWCGPTRVQDKAPWNNRVREDLFCLLNLFRNCFALPPAEGKSSPRSAGRFCPEALRSPETQRADANALRLVRSALLRADWTNEEAIHQPLA